MQTSSSSAPPPPPPPMFSPPLQQAAKKQRATATPQTDRLSLQAENAMSWRKAELARLQQQLPPPSASSSSNNTAAAAAAAGVSHADLLARARQSIHKQQAPPPPPPPPQPLPHERRTSDLYPEAPKTAARSGPPNNNNNTNNNNKEGPPIPSPPNTTPATAKVVRRLDVSFASDRNDRTTATTTTTTSSTTTGSIPPPPSLPLPHTMLSPPVVVATSFASYNSPELTVELPTTNTTNEQTSSNMQVHFGNEEQEEDSRAVKERERDFSLYAEEEDPIPPPVQTPGPERFLNHQQPTKKQPTPFVRAAVSMEDELEEDVNERRPSTAIPPPPPPALFQVSSNEDAPTSSRPPPPPPPPHPSSSSSSSSSSQPQSIEMRFIKEVQRLEQEKAQALQRVVELERSLQQQQHSFQTGSSASTTTTTTTFEFTTILQRMDEHYGDDVAWQWARQQVCAVYDQGTPLEHLESPAMNNNTTTTTTSSGMMMNRQAMPFPRPKTSPSSNTNTSTPTIIEEEFLIEAVRSVPFEFVDEEDATTFTVRRPYGLADERELWMKAGQATSKMYMKTASGMDGSSLEVIALIHADQSILAVYENGYARHQNAKGGDWEEFGNVYERNEPLGWILYRDAQNNGEEQQYSLDQVFEGIIAVRQYYCHSVVSAADILKRKQPTRQQAKAEGAVVSPGKDVGVDTKDLLLPKESSSNNSSGGKDSKSSSSPPSDEGSDILSTAFQMFISSLVHLLWNVFVRLPLRILFNVVALATAVGILAWMWVYYEYDSGAAHIGSSVHLMFNQPGIL